MKDLMDIESVMRDLYEANNTHTDRSSRLLEALLRAMFFVLEMLHKLVTRLDPAKEKKGRPRKTGKPVVVKEPTSSESEKDPFDEMVEPEAPAEGEKPAPKKRAPRKKADKPEGEGEGESEGEKPAPKKRAPRKKAEKPSESDGEKPEGEGESDGEKPAPKKRAPRKKPADAEEAVKVVRINEQGKKVAKTYKGVTYLKAADNVLYNENQEQVGRWDEDSKQVVLNAPAEPEEEENPEEYE
jgi:hypothetical protein